MQNATKKFTPPENSHEAMADNKPRDHRAGSAPMSPMTATPADARHRLSAGNSIVVPPAPLAQSLLQLPRSRSREIERCESRQKIDTRFVDACRPIARPPSAGAGRANRPHTHACRPTRPASTSRPLAQSSLRRWRSRSRSRSSDAIASKNRHTIC